MSVLDHWHPVCLERELGATPRRVWLEGEPYAVFRTPDDRIGALPDACPHRGMRLSAGQVVEGRLTCPYHGWAFAPGGEGVAPGTPQMTPRATCLEALSRFGLVWMRRGGATGPFPAVGPGGFTPVAVSRHRTAAPLETTLDNFTEVEHTGAVHWLLGYPADALDAVQVRVEATEDAVTVYNRGPQRPLPRLLARLLRLGPTDDFVDHWTTRFSPVHTVFEQYWLAPGTDDRRDPTVRIGVVYTPVHPDVTDVYTLVSANAAGFGLNQLMRWLLKGFAEAEVRLDTQLLGAMADPRASTRGRRLGRFDTVMRLHRKRIAERYRS